MEEVYCGKHYALHYQIALLDAEQPEYPQWATGQEFAVHSGRGVAVATANDTDIEVLIYKSEGEGVQDFGFHRLPGTIDVGSLGLWVGNETTADVAQVPWPPGPTQVEVYVNVQAKTEVTRITFVLKPLSPRKVIQ
jgi:hypothetical protein